MSTRSSELRDDLWARALRHTLCDAVRHAGRLIAFDLSFRRDDTLRFLERMKAEMPARFPGVDICDFGNLGDGGVHFNPVVGRDDPRIGEAAFETQLRDWVISVCVQDFEGSFSAEHAIGRSNQKYYEVYTPPELRRLAAALKSSVSPGPVGAVSF